MADIVDPNDVRMIELREDLSLGEEHLPVLGPRDPVGPGHHDGHGPLQLLVVSFVDDLEAALAQPGGDTVPAQALGTVFRHGGGRRGRGFRPGAWQGRTRSGASLRMGRVRMAQSRRGPLRQVGEAGQVFCKVQGLPGFPASVPLDGQQLAEKNRPGLRRKVAKDLLDPRPLSGLPGDFEGIAGLVDAEEHGVVQIVHHDRDPSFSLLRRRIMFPHRSPIRRQSPPRHIRGKALGALPGTSAIGCTPLRRTEGGLSGSTVYGQAFGLKGG